MQLIQYNHVLTLQVRIWKIIYLNCMWRKTWHLVIAVMHCSIRFSARSASLRCIMWYRIKQFHPTWRVFADDPTFGDEDCRLQEENRKQRRENQRNLLLRTQSTWATQNLDERRRKESKKRRKELATRPVVLDKKSCQIRQAKKEPKDTRRIRQKVVSVGKSLKMEPFKIPANLLEVTRVWREWIKDFKDETSYFEITEIRDCKRPEDLWWQRNQETRT